jgi:hypothetical protein
MPAVTRAQIDERIRWFRGKAEETRTIANDIEHSDTRITMLHIAETYEKLAEQLERQLSEL